MKKVLPFSGTQLSIVHLSVNISKPKCGSNKELLHWVCTPDNWFLAEIKNFLLYNWKKYIKFWGSLQKEDKGLTVIHITSLEGSSLWLLGIAGWVVNWYETSPCDILFKDSRRGPGGASSRGIRRDSADFRIILQHDFLLSLLFYISLGPLLLVEQLIFLLYCL